MPDPTESLESRAAEIATRHVGSPMRNVVAAVLEALQAGEAEVAEVRQASEAEVTELRRKLDVAHQAMLDADQELATLLRKLADRLEPGAREG